MQFENQIYIFNTNGKIIVPEKEIEDTCHDPDHLPLTRDHLELDIPTLKRIIEIITVCNTRINKSQLNFNVKTIEAPSISSKECFIMGEKITRERLAVDLISEVGPGGEYLTHNHTFQNFRNEFYPPIIEERSNFTSWQKNGALSIEKRANLKWKEILENFTEPRLPGDVERDLRKFVDRNK